jgi:hypothetical protein
VWYDYQGTRWPDMGRVDSIMMGTITSLDVAPGSPGLQRIRIGGGVSFRMCSLIFYVAVNVVAVAGRSWKGRDCCRETFRVSTVGRLCRVDRCRREEGLLSLTAPMTPLLKSSNLNSARRPWWH